jgi:hypothetical protein
MKCCFMCGIGLVQSDGSFCDSCKGKLPQGAWFAERATDPTQELLNQIRLRDDRIEDLEKTVLFLAQQLREARP